MDEVLERSALSFVDAKKQGYLAKAGETGIKSLTWKRRWCVLDASYFYYFESDAAKKPKGVIPMHLYDQVSKGGTGRVAGQMKHLFKLSNSKNPDIRTFTFGVESTLELEEWTDVLTKTIELGNHSPAKAILHEGVHDSQNPGNEVTMNKAKSTDLSSSIIQKLKLKILEVKMHKERVTYCAIFLDDVQQARTIDVPKSKLQQYDQEYQLYGQTAGLVLLTSSLPTASQ